MSRFDDMQRDYKEAVNQTRASFGLSPTDNTLDGIREVMLNYAPASINSYSQNDYMQDVSQPDGYQQTPGLGISDPIGSIAAGIEKWYAGDRPTYAESVAQLIRVMPNLTDQQFIDITAQLNAMKTDPTSGFYQNWYETTTSPYVSDIAARGIDVSGGIDDDWIAKNQHLLSGARRTDTGAIAKPTTKGTTAEWLAYDYAQIVQNWGSTKEVLNEEAALKKEIDYWVGRDDLNLSDEQILEQLDWKGKYKYLQGLKDAQSTGKRYNYTQPIDYNPDNLRGYIWAARNNGGSGNAEMDAVSAALGRGNVWQENKEISNKLDFKSDDYSPYSVKSTLDDAAQYFGVKEFEPGWAEKAAKTKIDWNNPDDVKYWQQVYNAESFTEQAETEVKEIYDRIDTMIAAGITDPAVIEDGLWDKGLDGSPALTALKKLDASMVRPDKLEGTTRPIDYRKQDVLDYINQQCAKVGSKETLPEFGQQMGQVLNADNSPAPVQPSFSPTPAPTQGPAATVGGSQPAGMPRTTEKVLATPAPTPDLPILGNIDLFNRTPVVNPDGSISTVDSFSVNIDGKEVLLPTIIAGKRVSEDEAINHYYETGEYLGKFDTVAEADDYAQRLHEQQERLYGDAANRILNTPAPSSTPAPVKPTPTPPPVVDQSAQAVNAAQSKIILDSAKTILATGTPDEKMVLNLAPTANAEGYSADLAKSIQDGTADMGAVYAATAKDANTFDAGHYMIAKQTEAKYNNMQKQLAEMQAPRDQLVQQRDQAVAQMQGGIITDVDRTEEEIDGVTHVLTADYDAANNKYIIHDSNPSDDEETNQVIAEYDMWLRSNLNMENYVAGRRADLQVTIDSLTAQINVMNGDIERQETAIKQLQPLYDQAQADIKTSQAKNQAVAMVDVLARDPQTDFTTPEGQQALAEATARNASLASSIDLVMDIGSQYVPAQWEPETILQTMADNGASSEEIARAGEEIVAESKKGLDELTGAIDQLQASGASIPREYKENLERKKKTYEDQIKSVEDYSLQNKPDFDDTVNASLKAVTDDINTNGGIFHPYKYNETSRFVAMALNGETPDIDTTQGNTSETSRWTAVALMRDDELKTYMYKLEESEEAATEYFNRLIDPSNGALHTRATNRQEEVWGNFADEHPVLALATSVAMSPAAAIPGSLYTAYSLATGQEINPNSGMFGGQTAQKAIESIAKEKILAPLEKGSVLYKLADLGLTGGIESLRGFLNKAAYGPANLIMMGLGAGASGAQDVKQIGGSNTQAAIMSGIDVAAETLGEIIPDRIMTKAFEKGAIGEGFFKGLLKDMAENSLGEMATEIAEKVPEDYVLGKLSTRNRAIAEYEQTMSHEDAVKQADKDFWHDVLMAGATGAVMSVGSSGLGYAAGRLSSTGTNTTTPTAGGQARAYALENGLPLDYARPDQTARTLSMLTSALNADKSSQTMALGAALMPTTGDQQSQNAAISAGMRLAEQLGPEKAIATVLNVIVDAEMQGADRNVVKSAVTVAALGQGEAAQVLERISNNSVKPGDIQALVDASLRDAQNPAITDRMQAVIHNDRVASRTRDLIGQGALNGVKPYEQAYSQAKAQEAQTQQNMETEQERAQAMGEHLQTVQAQHVEDPANQALAGAMKQAVKDVAGQVKVVGEYQQGLENQQQKVQEAEKDLNRVREEAMTKVREQAMADVQAEEQAEAQAEAEAQAKESPANYDDLVAQRDQLVQQRDAYQAQLDNNELPMQWQKFSTQNKIAKLNKTIQELDAQIAEAQPATPANNPNVGTLYTNDQVPVSYHWALVPASDLVTSNTDTGEANSAYPAELQPRDRTRAASQDQVAGMVRNLNPARLGESADAQNGAPIVGPDNVVESGNARTMAIRQAMASNPESAARYTQYVRDNAARFGLNPDDVTDNSVLVRVRDTDLDRVAFARAANESTTATYSPSENAQGDADRLTPRMMELFAPSDTGRLDTTENHAFALAFLNEIIPESERGAYMQDDGSISQQGYDRIRHAVFQRAYGSTALTQALTEDTDGSARNVMNALLKAAPRMMALQDAVDQGGVYDTGLAQTIAAAAERYMQLKNAGMSVEAYLEQTAMPGIQTEDEATQSFMRLFEEYRRSGKKLSEVLTNIADAVEDAGDPRAVSFLGQNEAPPLTELIRQGVERMVNKQTNQVSFARSGAVQGNNGGNNGGNGQGSTQETNETRPRRSPYEIARRLATNLDMGHAIGTRTMQNLPPDVAGYYDHQAHNMGIRSRNAGQYFVTQHEIFHGLSDRLGIVGTQQMIDNLPDAFRAAYTQAELPGEAFAEFGRMWMANRDEAVAFAGDAYVEQFEQALRRSPDYRAVMEARQDLQAFLNATAYDRMGAVIRNKSDITRQDTSIRHIISSMIDDTAAAEPINQSIRRQNNGQVDFNADVRSNALMKNFSSKVASAILNGNLTDHQGTIIGDGLAHRLEAAGVRGDQFDMLVRYMLAKHSEDRHARNLPVFDDETITPAQRAEFIADIEQNHPEIVRAEKAFQDFRREFMQAWLVDTGNLEQADFDTMNALYPHYVPTKRVMDNANSGTNQGNSANFRIRRATGGTQDIINPIDSFVDMVHDIVSMVKANDAAVAWDNAFHQYEGLGVFGQDITDSIEQETIDNEQTRQQIQNALSGQVGDDVLRSLLDLTRNSQIRANTPNVLTVVRDDGSRRYYEIYDPDLYKLLASQRNTDIGPVLRGISKLTQGMSALTTGSNPVFAIRNFMRDFQNSVNYGSWATDYVTGAAKWIRAAYDVWRNQGEYQDYAALGGGGWTRIDTGTRKGSEEYRSDLFRGYNRRNARSTAKWAAQKVWNGITFARLNEIVEQTSRYAEYKYGNQDKSTPEGRQRAFLNSQDVTVDFARRGNGQFASQLKAVIPFLSASTQGVYRTGRMVTEAERGRLPQRFAKTVINTALASAICNALLLRNSDDDEKEAYANMSDELKAQNFFLPNFAPGILGEQPLIRIPLSQDPLTYAVHGVLSNLIWSGSSEDPVVELEAIANTILDNLNPVGGTVLDPLVSMGTNKNWYGSRIVPSRLEDQSAENQYTKETPDLFVVAGRVLGVSPLKLQYAFEQYTGFVGQMLVPALSKDKNTGEIGGWEAAINAARKRLTSDPLISNDIVSSFYDGANLLTQVTSAVSDNKPLNMLRRGLTEDETNAAYAEAKQLTSSTGIVGKNKKAITDYYNQIDEINANESLTAQQKQQLTSEIRKQMIEETLVAQEAIGAYMEKYVTGLNIVNRGFEGAYVQNADSASMPQTFKDDENEPYMQKSKAVYEATGNRSALPHPQMKFTSQGVEYEIAPEDQDTFNSLYKTTYQKYIAANSAKWDAMTDDERLDVLNDAHNKARDAAKGWYKKKHNIK